MLQWYKLKPDGTCFPKLTDFFVDRKPKKFLLPHSAVSINPLTENGILRFCATALQNDSL